MIEDYFAAWNEAGAQHRRELLDRSVSRDVELVHPTWGRSRGLDALVNHIESYRSAMPGTAVVLTSEIDGHNGVHRYAWAIVDDAGRTTLEGLDVVETAEDGRLSRILLFHGRLDA